MAKPFKTLAVLAVLFVLFCTQSVFAQLTGTKTIGGGGDYATIEAAITDLNTLGTADPGVTFLIADGYYTPAASLNITTTTGSATAPIEFRPAPGATVQVDVLGGASGPAWGLADGVDFVTINGSNTGSGTDRSMKVYNISAGSNIGLKGFGQNVSCTFKNVITRTGATTTTNWNATACRGIDVFYTTTESNNFVVDNCQVSNAGIGIRVEGNSTTPLLFGIIIRNNTVDSCGLQGIHNIYNIGAQIYNNTVSCQLGTGTTTIGINVFTTNSGNFRVYNNTVFNVKSSSTSTSTTAFIAGIQVSSTSTANARAGSVFNNFVYDINYTAATGTAPVAGIWFAAASANTTPDTCVYNTVNLTGSNAANRVSYAFAFGSTTTTNKLFVRNNIFSNTMTSGTAISAGMFKGATGTTMNSNYNDIYVGSTSATKLTGRIVAVAYETMAQWRTGSGGDANSFSENPPFTSATNLHIPDGTGTQLESGGVVVPTTNFDIDNVTRNASTPDIGGDEFNGVAVDLTGPAISYTNITNTSSSANRTLTDFATITDLTGVNTTSGTKPRIYYKKSTDANAFVGNTSGDNGWKWVEATDAASPFDFTIDYSLIFGGSVTGGDLVNYFVVAQDIVSTPNVGANPSGGFVGTTVAAISSAPATPNSYNITAPPLSGDYTVGLALFRPVSGGNFYLETRTRKVMREVPMQSDNSPVKGTESNAKELTAYPVLEKGKTMMQEVEETYSVPMLDGKEYTGSLYHEFTAKEKRDLNIADNMAGVYATVTAALADASLRGISGATRFLLTDVSYLEAGSMTIPAIAGVSAVNTLTIKPQTGVTTQIAVNSTSPVFISNSDYIIWDGSNTLGGTTRDMTILNNGVTAGSSGGVFTGSSVAVNYNVVKNCILKNSGSTIAYGVVFNSGSNNTATNNVVTKANLGIQAQGSLGQGSNVTIDQNVIGDAVDRIGNKGIVVYATNGFTITQNTVSEINNALAANCDGILAGFVTTSAVNGTISRNKISNIVNTSASGYGAHGIQVAAGAACNITVYDNVITGILGSGDNITSGLCIYNPSGILVTPTSTPTGTTGVSIYNNSIYMSGINAAYSPSAGWTGSACVMVDTLSGNIDMRNNAMRNDATGLAATYTPYAIFVRGAGSPFTSLNYNVYYENTGAPSQLFGRYNSVNFVDYTSWAASGVGEGSSSAYADPGFTSVSDLAIDASSPLAWNVNGMGTPISTVAVDFNGASRSTTVATGSTDIGAYNVTPATAPPTATASAAPAVNTTTTYTLNGRTIGSLAWGPGGTPPTSMDVTFYAGTNPPGAGAFPVGNGYWVFTATGGSGYSYDVIINYDDAQLGTVSPEADLRLAKSDDGGALYTPYLVAGTGAGEYELNTTANTIKVYGLTSFSTFAVTDNDNPLPVELSSFTSSIDKRKVTLNWSTAAEQNNSGFDIERKSIGAGNSWSKVGNVAGAGNSNATVSYNFVDNNVNTGKYNYRLKQIDFNGNFKYYDLSAEVIVGVPSKFEISQNYPNPFNPSTKINFDLPFDSKVQIKIFDMTGKEMAQIVNESRAAGYYTVQFNASSLSSGIYFYQINATGGSQSFVKTMKMVLVK